MSLRTTKVLWLDNAPPGGKEGSTVKRSKKLLPFHFLTNVPFLHSFLQNNLQDFGYTHNVLTTQADATGVKNGGKREEEKKKD
jgi:hypothetical protein